MIGTLQPHPDTRKPSCVTGSHPCKSPEPSRGTAWIFAGEGVPQPGPTRIRENVSSVVVRALRSWQNTGPFRPELRPLDTRLRTLPCTALAQPRWRPAYILYFQHNALSSEYSLT